MLMTLSSCLANPREQSSSRKSNTGLTNTNSSYLQKNPPPSSPAD
ncbi:hypothetical protein AVEN_154172-1, partial [Araneus ventricosus]